MGKQPLILCTADTSVPEGIVNINGLIYDPDCSTVLLDLLFEDSNS